MDKISKQYTELKKVSKVEKEKKSETSEQRLQRNTRFLKDVSKAASIAVVLGVAGMNSAMADQSRSLQNLSGSDNATGLTPASDQRAGFTSNNLTDHRNAPPIDQKYIQELDQKLKNPPWVFEGPKDAQGTSSGETSQSSKETHQGEQDKNKGMEPSSVSKKKIVALQALVKADRQRIESLIRKVERQMARQQRQLKEQESREPEQSSKQARRKLGFPATPGACLQWDTASTVTGTVVPVAGGGTALGVDYNLNVQNTCTDTINSVQYQIIGTGTCPSGCAKATVGETFNLAGVPSSIDQGGTSTGTKYEPVTCQQTDANGGQTPVAPESFTVQAQPLGWRKSNAVSGGWADFEVYS